MVLLTQHGFGRYHSLTSSAGGVRVIAFVLFMFWSVAPQARIHGSVHDAQTGESMVRVSVRVKEPDLRTQTDDNGNFDITSVPPGDYQLIVSCVGYRSFRKTVAIGANADLSLDVVLSPEAIEHKDTVDVHAGAFDLESDAGPTDFDLSGTEAKNLASVLADDPLRALQTAPGVAADDDFESRFSVHGAPYTQLGLYLDGILLHEPFHTVQGEGPSGSVAVFNGDMVADMSIETEGYGAQFEDRTAGVIDVRTREGSTDGMHFRLSAGAPDIGLLAEGPFGKRHKASWLLSVRKSYLQYFLKDLSTDAGSLAFGFFDTEARLNYQLSQSQTVSLLLIDGTSELDRSSAKSILGLNAAEFARYHYTLANLGWRFTPNQSFVSDTHVAFTRERYDNSNIIPQPLGNGYYGEWSVKSDARWSWSNAAQLEFGAVAKPAHAEGFANYFTDDSSYVTTNWYRGDALYTGSYVQQAVTSLAGRISMELGGRWDRLTADQRSVLSPQASIAYTPWAGGKLSVARGRYAVFPEISSLYAENGSPRLEPALSDQFTSAFEQRLGERARFRIQAFRRDDRNLLFQPLMEARLIDGQIVGDNYQSPILNTLGGVTRGLSVFLQRRSANGWTGWVSYTYSESDMHDTLTGIRFPSDEEQRHTINGYLSYRLRPSVNLSAKLSWGSGFPVPGFFRLENGTNYLAAERNQVRLPPYQRLDLRMNKSIAVRHGRMSLFVEVVNLLDNSNYRFDSYNGYNPVTGQAYISLMKMFPILPTAGVTFDL